MAPKRSCKGKKRSKKCPRSGKRSCSRVRACAKPSLFMDDIRWLQFKKAAMEAIAAAKLVTYTLATNDITNVKYPNPNNDPYFVAYKSKVGAQNTAWAAFYNAVNPQFITPKLLVEAKSELEFAVAQLAQLLASLPLGTKADYLINNNVIYKDGFVFHYIPFSSAKIIKALKDKQDAVSTALVSLRV